MKEYGTLSTIIKSNDKIENQIDSIGVETQRHFALISEMLDRLSFEKIKQGNIISNWQEIEYFCIQKLSHEPVENLMIILLDNQNRIIAIEKLGGGTVNQMMVYPREVFAYCTSE